MSLPITVPRLGWSMDQGTFVGWLKTNGEPVKAGEPLFSLEGDKASQEIEATDSGILHIAPNGPKPGDTVAVGAVLGQLLGENESITQTDPAPPPASEKEVPLEAAPSGAGCSTAPAAPSSVSVQAELSRPAVTISPRARRRAAELGMDYQRLKGSGRTGRIIEADILDAAQEARASSLSPMRRKIAQRTAESFSKTPHFYLRTEIDATALLEFRQRVLSDIEQAAGVRVTLSDLLLRAQALALRDCPFANARWQNDQIERLSGCDVGLVIALDEGLRIAIMRGADGGDLAALARQRASLVDAARTGKLSAEAQEGGATSLSNLGNTCVDEFAAVIASPQSSMLAVGRAIPRPLVVGGRLEARTTLNLCLSADHRVMDGKPAAQFLEAIVQRLLNPTQLT